MIGLLDSVRIYSDGRYKGIGWLPSWGDVTGKPSFSAVATTGAYSSLTGIPNIPTTTSQLTNNSGFISSESDPVWSGVSSLYRTKSQNDLLYYPISGNPSNYITLSQVPADAVQSVNGKVGVVVINKSDVGLSNVDNTSDANKPVSSAVLTALNGKQPIGNYLTSFTETDPTVSSYAKSLTGFSVIKTSTDALYKPIGYTPSNAEVIASLGLNPINTAGARTAISLTTTGTGSATYNSSTGELNIPTPATGIRVFISTATLGQSRAQLNTSYPTANVGDMVLAPSILLGGAVYVKSSTTGGGTWQTISAPPTL